MAIDARISSTRVGVWSAEFVENCQFGPVEYLALDADGVSTAITGVDSAFFVVWHPVRDEVIATGVAFVDRDVSLNMTGVTLSMTAAETQKLRDTCYAQPRTTDQPQPCGRVQLILKSDDGLLYLIGDGMATLRSGALV